MMLTTNPDEIPVLKSPNRINAVRVLFGRVRLS